MNLTPAERRRAQQRLARQFAEGDADNRQFANVVERRAFIDARAAATMATCAEIEAASRGDTSLRDARLAREDAEALAAATQSADERSFASDHLRQEYICGFVAGRLGERGRIERILAAPEAKHRRDAAFNLALTTALTVEDVRRVLASLPERRESSHLTILRNP